MLYLLLLPLGVLVGVMMVLNYDKLQRFANGGAESSETKQQKPDKTISTDIADENLIQKGHVHQHRHRPHHHRKHSSRCSHRGRTGRRSTSVRQWQRRSETHTLPQHDMQGTKLERHTTTTSPNLPMDKNTPNIIAARTGEAISHQTAIPLHNAQHSSPIRRTGAAAHPNQVQQKDIDRSRRHGHHHGVLTSQPTQLGGQQRRDVRAPVTTPQQGHYGPLLQQDQRPRVNHTPTTTPLQTQQHRISDRTLMLASHQGLPPHKIEAQSMARRQNEDHHSGQPKAPNQPHPPLGGSRDGAKSDKSASQQRMERKRITKKTVSTSRRAAADTQPQQASKELSAIPRDKSGSNEQSTNRQRTERKIVSQRSVSTSQSKRMPADNGKAKRFGFLRRRSSDPHTSELAEQTAITN